MVQITNENIHECTIRRILIQNNLKSYVGKRKPFLTKLQRQKRIDWCLKYQHKSLEFWRKVIFSDESTFCVQTSDVNRRIRRSSLDNPYDDKYLIKTIKRPPFWMIWGCFQSNKLGLCSLLMAMLMHLCKSKEILEKSLLPFHQSNDIFQDDSAPAHRAASIRNYLEEKGIERLDWPSNSPDLNLIEHVWAYLSMCLRRRNITTKARLKEEIIKIWENEINGQFLDKLIESISFRINECLKNNGGATKY